MPLYISNDMLATLKGYSQPSADDKVAYLNGVATLKVSVYDLSGNPITGAQNLVATYVPNSNGCYGAVIPGTASITLGTTYECRWSDSARNFTTSRYEMAQKRTD